MLKNLKKKYRIALASSANMDEIQFIIKQLKIGKYFDAVVSAEHMNSKPAPDVFLEAAEQLDVDPKTCIVVEDAVKGIEAGIGDGEHHFHATSQQILQDLRQPCVWIQRDL